MIQTTTEKSPTEIFFQLCISKENIDSYSSKQTLNSSCYFRNNFEVVLGLGKLIGKYPNPKFHFTLKKKER